MSDLISRQAAIDLAKTYEFDDMFHLPVYEEMVSVEDLRKLPSAQPEIIRCKDCKHYTSVTARCEVRGKGLYLIRGMEDFCSRAERKTDD